MSDAAYRVIVVIGSLIAGVLFVALLTILLPSEEQLELLQPGEDKGMMADFLLDRNTKIFSYPFTIQNLSWLIFFGGCGLLWIRIRQSTIETNQIKRQLLPEDGATMLRSQDLGVYYKAANADPQLRNCYLQRLISRTILQFQSSRSVDQANSLMNSSLELFQHELDLNYHILRYIVWLIPTLGFFGTVIGIALALNQTGKDISSSAQTIADPNVSGSTISGALNMSALQDPQLLLDMTANLGVAFYTTMLALLLSAILVLILHIVQQREERALNRAGQYCMDNLINRLFEK